MRSPKIPSIVFSLAAVVCSLTATLCFADSQIRIVRLSDVEGGVQINRNVNGYEKAFLNLPITQGNQVRTQSDGRAQIEFEDGSALRIAPDTTVEFPELSLADSGTRISNVDLKTGTVYIDLKDTKNDELTLTFRHQKIVLTRPAHLRIVLSDTSASVAVFSGQADVENPSGTIQVSKNRTAIFDLTENDSSKLVKNIEPDPFDAWDKQQDRYEQRYNNGVIASSTPYSYGLTDLSYYGSYFNMPGYGMMWQPYFASATWNPFMDGAWAFYPGVGYCWVSGYPWGWTPFHSGSWTFINGHGWGWRPNGTWTALNTRPQLLNAPASFAAPKPPATVGSSLILINRGPFSAFAGDSANKVLIRNDSAGLGIPRGGVRNLSGLSERANTQGMITARIHTVPVQRTSMNVGGYHGTSSAVGSRSVSSPRSFPSSHASPGMSSAGHGSRKN